MKTGKIATIINFCTNEKQFIRDNIAEARLFSSQIIVPYSDHFFDNTPEDMDTLRSIAESFPDVTFVQFPFIPDISPRKIWHSIARYVGFKHLNPDIQTVLFLDADEICNGKNVSEWLRSEEPGKYDAVLFSCYWYFREPIYRSTTRENAGMLIDRRFLTKDLLLHPNERTHIFENFGGRKREETTAPDGSPLSHHFSWARPKEQMLKKVTAWGHSQDGNWTERVREEYAHPFNGTDFVHGYKYETVQSPFAFDENFATPQNAPVKNLIRLTKSDLLNLLNTGTMDQTNQRKFLISIVGGVGDHVTAEPIARYMIKKLFPHDDLRIVCYWPELFSHLGIPVYKHSDQFDGRDKFTVVHSLPGEYSDLFRIACFLGCHMSEYHALAMIKRTLPISERDVKLPLVPESVEKVRKLFANHDLSKIVLVHTGKSWKSKTFPADWWLSVIQELIKKNYMPVIVGKSVSDIPGDKTGVVDFTAPPGTIDLRDKLNLGELTAAISLAPVLLTNDSSPVQIAGAFDNWIVMVATIKHPELVFPFRHGSVNYKTKSLCKKMVLPDENLNPISGEKISVEIDVENWNEYIPEPHQIAEEIKKMQI